MPFPQNLLSGLRMNRRGFIALIPLFLCFMTVSVTAQRAIRIEPDYFNNEIVITDTLIPVELNVTLYTNRATALSELQDPVPLDSVPDADTYLYRVGTTSRYPVLLIYRKEHWAVIPLPAFTGYGIPHLFKVKTKRLNLILVEASRRDRFFTSEELPSGYQAEIGLLEVVDVSTGIRHLQQESRLNIEQGRWSNDPGGNSATSFEQSTNIAFNGKMMEIKVSSTKQRYTTASGKEEKSQEIILEYEFKNGSWIRRKAVMLGF
jgi:hypothetical protein